MTRHLSRIAIIISVLFVGALVPANAASDDTRRDMKGFDEQMVRREQAEREVRKGKVFLEDKSYELARRSFENALRLVEDLHEARFCMGLTEYRDGKFKLAAAHFEKLYELKPDFKNLHLELARTYLALGRCPDALRWIELHRERNNEDSDEVKKLREEIEECIERRENQS